MTVVVRTHGGLGNQLFQILYARLEAARRGTDYVEIHDLGYAHRFDRSIDLSPPPSSANNWQRLVSRMRLPKALQRAGLNRSEVIRLPGGAFLDGYFQQAGQYARFEPAAILAKIDQFRRELKVSPSVPHDQRTLYHLRLGDFFDDPEAKFNHVLARIKDLAHGSVIITNQEELLSEPPIVAELADKGCTLHPSGDYSGEQVVRFMATFSRIVTNDSTLAFWASVLGGCQTSFEDKRLSELHRMLFRIANASPRDE